MDLLSSSITSYTTLTAPYTIISNNAYISGSSSTLSSVYKNNGGANSYNQGGGVHIWRTAPSGTAGQPITWNTAMTLDSTACYISPNTTFPRFSVGDRNGIIDKVISMAYDVANDVGLLYSFRNNYGARPLALNHFGGNLLIGTTTDNGVDKLQVNGSIAVGSSIIKTVSDVGENWVSTGISVNAADGGRTIMIMASYNSSSGNSTSSVYAMVRCGYNGNNFSTTVIASDYTGGGSLGTRHVDGILQVTFNGGGGNVVYRIDTNK